MNGKNLNKGKKEEKIVESVVAYLVSGSGEFGMPKGTRWPN